MTQTLAIGIAIMAAVTFLTRFGGVFLMRYVPLTPTVERFLKGMANTVLVAIVAPMLVQGDLALWAGASVAVCFFYLTQMNILAVALGVAATALARLLI